MKPTTIELLALISNESGNGALDYQILHRLLETSGWPHESLEVRFAIDSIIRECLSGKPAFEWNPGGWKVTVTDATTQGVVCSAMLWGILVACGVPTGLPAIIIPSVLSLFFKIEKVKLTFKEEDVALRLCYTSGFKEKTPEELYDSLDPSERLHLNYFDFLDVLEKLKQAGRAMAEKGYWKILPAGERRFRVEFE